MTKSQKSLILFITPYLSRIEKILLILLVFGFTLMYLDIDEATLKASLLGLSITYFLSAFTLIDIPYSKGHRHNFMDLLALSITPKVLWISTAVSLFGVFIYFLQPGSARYETILTNGVLVIGIGIAVLAYAAIAGVRHLKYVVPVLFRAIPVVIVDIYLLFGCPVPLQAS